MSLELVQALKKEGFTVEAEGAGFTILIKKTLVAGVQVQQVVYLFEESARVVASVGKVTLSDELTQVDKRTILQTLKKLTDEVVKKVKGREQMKQAAQEAAQILIEVAKCFGVKPTGKMIVLTENGTDVLVEIRREKEKVRIQVVAEYLPNTKPIEKMVENVTSFVKEILSM